MHYEIWIDGNNIKDADSFHNEFAKKMGFFDGYGRNMNAWIDCMRDIYTNGEYESITRFNLYKGDSFTCNIDNANTWISYSKETFEAFIEAFKFIQKEASKHGDIEYLLNIHE
jgi:hypothetical protein